MVAKVAVVIETRRGGEGEVRNHHPGIFREDGPAVTGDLADWRYARHFFVFDAESVVQLITGEVDPQRQLVVAQRKGVRAVGFIVFLLNELRTHARHTILGFSVFVADEVLHFQQIVAVPGMLRK